MFYLFLVLVAKRDSGVCHCEQHRDQSVSQFRYTLPAAAHSPSSSRATSSQALHRAAPAACVDPAARTLGCAGRQQERSAATP
eukprot:1579675-Pleurochrysis_carterae.AAC.2